MISGYLRAPSPAAKYFPFYEKERHEKDLIDLEKRNLVCLFSFGEKTQITFPAG
jgi:hypothetical protein